MAGGAADGGAQEPAAAAVLLLRESFQQLASVPSGQGEGLASTALPGCLVSERFLQHTDREVRLWTARCLAEALRIREPGPGWLELGRLPAVLGLFVEQVGLLLDPAGPVRAGALEFVERLADWGSGSVFALAFQHPDPGGLVAALVEACLQAARGERPEGASEADDPDRAERALCRLVSSVLVDAEELPAPEIAVLPLIDELKPAHSKSPARRFVRCTLEELARRDAALVVDLALQAQLFPTVAEEAESVVPPPEAYKPLLSVVRQLFEVDRALVARTLPRLGALLRCRDAECRGAVTRLFGRLLAHPFAEGGAAQAAAPAAHPLPAQAALLATHPLLLEGFLERFDDGEALVRLAALKGGAALLAAAAALVREGRVRWGGEARGLMGGTGDDQALVDAAGEAAARLVQRRLDPDEGVRLRVVEVATEAAEGARSADELRLVEEALPLIFERVLDRRGPKLREACARCMAQLFAKHARSRWTSGEEATGWEWVPRLLCQAYSVFLASHTGGVALLEELIEVHLLGCAMAGDAASQARALRGLFEAACEQEDSAAGLRLLLCRKRDANAALWQFLRRRRGHTGGRLQDAAAAADALACCKAEGGQLVQAGSEAALALEAFGRFNPQLEEPRARLEAHLEALGALEAVKDRAVWDHLGKLCSPAAAFATADRQPLLLELQRLLKVHRLGALWPLLRRALLCTWLLPDQVPALLEARPGAPAAARRLIAELPKYFPGAFAHHAEAVAGRLVGAVPPEGSLAALRSLAAAGKRRAAACDGGEPWPEAPPGLDPKRYTDALLEAVAAQAPDRAARGPACRKAVHALGLLPPEERPAARARLLRWADEASGAAAALPGRRTAALHLAAACLAAEAEAPGARPLADSGPAASWLEAARQAVLPGAEAKVEVRHAAAEVIGAIGGEDDLASLLGGSSEVGASVQLHAVVSVLRGLRRGSLCLSTRLLSHLSAQVCTILASQQPSSQKLLGDLLLGTLQKTQRSALAGVRLADHLRLCTTLPTIFALSPIKAQQEASQRTLQASLRRAMQQAAARRESLLDYAVACFLHFLSRQDFFQVEAAAAASKFPESTRLSDFFCRALSRSDPARGTEHLGMALQVCQRSRHFADRERPASDGVHKAANVLRYAVERSCPELARQPPPLSLGAALRGSMPASLFVVRLPAAHGADDAPALQAPPPAQLPPAPLPLQDAGAAPPPDAEAREASPPQPAAAPPPAAAAAGASPARAAAGRAAGASCGAPPRPAACPPPPGPAPAAADGEATPEGAALPGARAGRASVGGGGPPGRRRVASPLAGQQGGGEPPPRASPRLAALKRPAAPAAGAGGAAAGAPADAQRAAGEEGAAGAGAKRRRESAGGLGGGAS